MHIIARPSDVRRNTAKQRRAAWTAIAVTAVLIVVLAANPIVTDSTIWIGALLYARVAVVDRRRARRAAHRAALWDRIATAEAVEVGNARTAVSAA